MANVDFVIFPPRWMVAERTFRPPYFHRNVMSEFMGLVRGEYDAKQGGFVPGRCEPAQRHERRTARTAPSYAEGRRRRSSSRSTSPGTLAFMFESRYVFEPTAHALASPAPRPRLRRGVGRIPQGLVASGERQGNEARLAQGPRAATARCASSSTATSRARRRSTAIAPTMQQALESWDRVRGASCATRFESLQGGHERHAFDFQEALATPARVAAPLPRAYEWLDGSAYLTHVERVRRARNDKVPESFYSDPLMYQGGAGAHDGAARSDPRALRGLGHRPRGRGGRDRGRRGDGREARARPQARCGLLTLVNDVSFRRLIPAELAKGFGFVNGKGANALAPVACTPDELGERLARRQGAPEARAARSTASASAIPTPASMRPSASSTSSRTRRRRATSRPAR